MTRKSSFDASCSKYDYGGRGRMRQKLARDRGTKEERLAQTQKDEEGKCFFFFSVFRLFRA